LSLKEGLVPLAAHYKMWWAMEQLIPYLRKSSGEDEAQSFARQRAAITQWAETNGVELADEIREPGVSGNRHWRDRRLGEAVQAVADGEAAGIVVEELSRLTRGRQSHAADLWDALNDIGARLVVTAEGMDTAHGDQELNFGLRALLAREQWKQYARRMDHFKRRKTADGVAFGPMPIGYRKDADGRAEVDPETSAIVRELFERRLAGEATSSLARWLQEVAPPRFDANGKQRTWTRQAVTFLLANELYYTGRVSYGEYVSEVDAGTIVSPELFHAVQRAPGAPTRGPASWLLSGLIYCGVCEERLQSVITTGGTPRKYRYYRCLNKDCPKPRPGARAERIEDYVMTTCWQLLGSSLRDAKADPELPLREARVELTRRLWDEVREPSMQEILGAEWPATVQARRQDHEAALTALGEAQAADAEPSTIDLREQWETMDDQERRAALHRYLVARVMVKGPKPEQWEVVWK
jgi:DNA invertase Pin-like site-specific DNA recombinase